MELKKSKPIAKIKKGDKVKIDGKEYEVDAHFLLIDHGKTKEMAIELINEKKEEEDYQIRYFVKTPDNMRVFELHNEFMYMPKEVKKVEW